MAISERRWTLYVNDIGNIVAYKAGENVIRVSSPRMDEREVEVMAAPPQAGAVDPCREALRTLVWYADNGGPERAGYAEAWMSARVALEAEPAAYRGAVDPFEHWWCPACGTFDGPHDSERFCDVCTGLGRGVGTPRVEGLVRADRLRGP